MEGFSDSSKIHRILATNRGKVIHQGDRNPSKKGNANARRLWVHIPVAAKYCILAKSVKYHLYDQLVVESVHY